MSNDELISHIRERVERCRRMAGSINDQAAQQALLEMAQQGEDDIRKLEVKGDGV